MSKIDRLIGNEKRVNEILNLDKNKLPHAILFEGISGIGKKTVALNLSKSLFCHEENSPCEKCPKCLQFESNSLPDFKFISSQNGSLKKESIEKLIEFLSIKPYDNKYKVVVVEDFHLATIEAQNSLLKTLEEPPDYAKIILLSENNKKILETILSRTQVFTFRPIEDYKIAEYINRNYNIKMEEAKFIASFSNGSVGKAIKLSEDRDFLEKRKNIVDIFDSILKSESSKVFSKLDLLNIDDDLDFVLDMFLLWLRDLSIFKSSGDINLLFNRDYKENFNSETYLSYSTIEKIVDLTIKLKKDLNYNLNKDLALRVYLINVMEECA